MAIMNLMRLVRARNQIDETKSPSGSKAPSNAISQPHMALASEQRSVILIPYQRNLSGGQRLSRACRDDQSHGQTWIIQGRTS